MRAKAAPIDRTLILKDKIWTARLRIDHVAIFQASDSRVFKAAAVIDSAEADLAAIDSAVVIASAVEDLADSAEADSVVEVDGVAKNLNSDGE